ncbi:MAG: hypothetical protein J6113_09510 [Lachnospiraceae bacterium]|nr:hypothetical protein [Lachnospiraceae bacterium]
MKAKSTSERNVYLDVQIQTQIMQVENFLKLCEHAAKKDDGKVDGSEAKLINSITKESEKYIKSLKKLL